MRTGRYRLVLAFFSSVLMLPAYGQVEIREPSDIADADEALAVVRALEERGAIGDIGKAIDILDAFEGQGSARLNAKRARMRNYVLGRFVSYTDFFEQDQVHLKVGTADNTPTFIMQFNVGCPACMDFLIEHFDTLRRGVSEGHLNAAFLALPMAVARLGAGGDRTRTATQTSLAIHAALNCVYEKKGDTAFFETLGYLVAVVDRDIDNEIRSPSTSNTLSNRFFLFAEERNFREDAEVTSVTQLPAHLLAKNELTEAGCPSPIFWESRYRAALDAYDFKYGREGIAPSYHLNGRTFGISEFGRPVVSDDPNEMIVAYISLLTMRHAFDQRNAQ